MVKVLDTDRALQMAVWEEVKVALSHTVELEFLKA